MNFKKLSIFLELVRLKQWVKNFFVFAPILFSGNLSNFFLLTDTVYAFFFFCLASSATYIVNDLYDIKSDKFHPTKLKKKPIANGSVKKSEAYFILTLLIFSLPFSILINFNFFLAIFSYFVLNLFYTFKLKKEPIFDIFSIAISFVIRVISGSFATDLKISAWMCITTFCLALYLALIKRRQEFIHSNLNSRNVLKRYSLTLINKYAEISIVSTFVFYSIFVINYRPEFSLTIPFVLFGLFRYLYLIEIENKGESPSDLLLEDKSLKITILFWVLLCIFLVK
jgi:decaprenyl-phosphate phosphoribosyltransferase